MIRLDYLYVTNWSLWWDIKLLLRTVFVVMNRRGANYPRSPTRAPCILMLLGNTRYEIDTGVLAEAVSLVAADTRSSSWPRGAPGAPIETIDGVVVRRFPQPPEAPSFVRTSSRHLGHGRLPRARVRIRWAAVTRSTSTTRRRRSSWSRAVQARRPARGVRPSRPRAGALRRRHPRRGRAIVRRVLEGLERLSCRLADRVVTTNSSHRKVEVERCGVDPSRIAIVCNGPDPDPCVAIRPLLGAGRPVHRGLGRHDRPPRRPGSPDARHASPRGRPRPRRCAVRAVRGRPGTRGHPPTRGRPRARRSRRVRRARPRSRSCRRRLGIVDVCTVTDFVQRR